MQEKKTVRYVIKMFSLNKEKYTARSSMKRLGPREKNTEVEQTFRYTMVKLPEPLKKK